MAKTAIIYDFSSDYKEKIGKGLFGGDKYKYFRKYYFNIQYPDNTEENIEYGIIDFGTDGSVRIGDKLVHDYNANKWSDVGNFVIREKCLQRIVNDLENKGYNVYPDQLALFMKNKIDKLIMQKK